MLKELIDKGYYSIHDGFDNWEDAVRASVQPLIDAGAVKPAYADSIVNSVKKFGPYIVIAPDIAIPHAEDKPNVNETTICFMKSNTPVVFDPEDHEKDARLFFVLEHQGYLNDSLNTAPAAVLVLPMTGDLSPAIALATRLRGAGIRTQIHAEQKKFKQKLSYADKLHIPYAVLLGEDEIAQGACSVKDLRTGEQVTLSPDQAVAHIQAGLELLNRGTPILDKEG